MHIEKESLVNKKVAAATIIAINSINSRRLDLSKPASVRVLAACSSGKHIKKVTL
jgi:hypothetical protein